MSNIIVKVAGPSEHKFADEIRLQIEESAKARGTGIAKRSLEYIQKQMTEGKAIVAFDKKTDQVAGFCYIESFGHKKYVSNSGLIVFPEFRNQGLAKKIKEAAFKLSRKKYPEAKLFGLTTSLAVMKINSELGYHPVTFSELTDDEDFWKGCSSCINYEILQSKDKKNCLCTGMLYDSNAKKKRRWDFLSKVPLLRRLKRIKEKNYLKKIFGGFKVAR